MHIRKPYEPIDKKNARRPLATKNTKPSRTKQSLAEDLDVNNIVRKYNGDLQAVANAHAFEALYGDFDSMDMKTAIDKVEKAKELFLAIPSSVRGHFDNDAGAFIDYATNPDNLDQMRQWGLAEAERPPEAPIEVRVVNEQQNPTE